MIAQLRKRTTGGSLYHRPETVSQELESLYQLSIEEVAQRAQSTDERSSEHISSECIVHFVRQSKSRSDTRPYQDLYRALRRRVLALVPVSQRSLKGGSKVAEKQSEQAIRDYVMDRFQELLCSDRNQYQERLDFYEIRFNSAIAKLRATARRNIRSYQSRQRPLAYQPDASGYSDEVENALARLREPACDPADFLYRSRLCDAIKVLRPPERRVVELLLQGMPIESKDPKVLSIVQVVGCMEKTVRNRRDRAIATIRAVILREEVA